MRVATGYSRHVVVAALACSAVLLAVLVPPSPIDGWAPPASPVQMPLGLIAIVAVGTLVDVGATWLHGGPLDRSFGWTPWSLIGALLLPLWPAVVISAMGGVTLRLALRLDRRVVCGAVVADVAAITACHLATALLPQSVVQNVLWSAAIGSIALISVRSATASWLAIRPWRSWWHQDAASTWWVPSDHLAVYAVGTIACLLSLISIPAVVLLVPVTAALLRARQATAALTAARLDDKTGLLRPLEWRRLAHIALERRRKSEHQSVAVVIIDLDHFKALNDTHGHVVGDLALTKVAECLRATFRKDDIVGRFGGEEFTALLPRADLAEGIAAANRAIERVRQIVIHDGVRITASAGVAVFPTHGRSVTDVLAAADRALYGAKSSGRDRAQAA